MQLNSQQQKAVHHTDGPLLVLAGPGSGKTRVLVNRIAHLLASGAAYPSQVLAVTFTNKAAGEMQRRVEEMVGPDAREITIGTFHSVCLKILRLHFELAGLSRNFLVYDEADQMVLIKECMSGLNIDRERMPPRSMLDRISRAKDACQGPEEFSAASASNPYLKQVARIYDLYQHRLEELSAVDFGDIIRLVVKLLEKDAGLRESYQRRWQYILVDEYQDTNPSQYRFLSNIVSAHRNICVVGDDDQSIYRWRGADISNILRFENDFPGANVVRLEQNYRSTNSIIAVAQAVVSKNAGRKPKRIWTERGDGAKVVVLSCTSDKHEAQVLAGRIADAHASAGSYNDFAIFYRTNAQSRAFEEIFREKGIPYRIYGGIRFYERAEVKDVIAYMRLIADKNDDVGFLRIINVPPRGLGKTTIERLKAMASDRKLSLFEALPLFVESGLCRSAQAKRFIEFRETMVGLAEGARNRPLGDLTRDLLEKTGIVGDLIQRSTLESEARLENINELVAAVMDFAPAGGDPPLVQFLDQVALISDADAVDDAEGAVTMMTLHIAKGLEYPKVFIVGMEEGLLPHARSLDDPDALEEERRLCYVGMTRAKDELCLTHSFRRRLFGHEHYSVVSRFVGDVPKEHCLRMPSTSHEPRLPADDLVAGVTPARRRFSGGSYGFDDFDQRPPEEVGGIMKGRRVCHPSFGTGVIKSCERTSMGHKVTVQFQGGITKRLIAELSGLTLV